MHHLTGRASPAAPALDHQETGSWLWTRLREAFPQAIGVVVMPDHLHLLCELDPRAAEQRLVRLLGHFARAFGVRGGSAHVPPAEAIRSTAALARHVRYVALNPCRKGLVACPLMWPWSTHRDVVGACVDPWITAERLATTLGAPRRGFEARHHAYVSGDPHASVTGTSLPRAAPRVDIAAIPLQALIEAVASATRTSIDEMPRGLLVALALDQGWRQTSLLARVTGCSTRTIQRLSREVDARALQSARLCAGDERLRILPRRVVNRDRSSA